MIRIPPSDEETATSCRGTLHDENSPLLHNHAQPAVPKFASQSEGAATTIRPGPSWQREAKTIALWSVPLTVSFLLQRSISAVSVVAMGRIGTIELGAVSLASITANLIGNTMIQGLANSLDTLASQAYGGGHRHLVGLHMQRMVCFIFVCTLPLMILWWHSGKLLSLVLSDQQLAELAGTYLKIMILRTPAFILFECGKRFLMAQGLFYVSTYVLLIAAPLNVTIMWVLIWRFDWGFVGAPIAIAVTENLMAVLLFLYVYLIGGSECWGGLTKKIFLNWGPMIRIAVPGMIMHVTEFAADEVLTLASARFGTSQLAAQSALVTLASITYNVPSPVSVAASNRVANWIGANAIHEAKTSAKVAFVFGVIIALFNMVILITFQRKIPFLFTQDPEVIEIIIGVFPIATAMQTLDSMAVISHGLLRGVGCQEFGGYLNLVVYYFIAIPISLGTGFFFCWELSGLWTGITVGLAMVALVEFWWLYNSEWKGAADKAAWRNREH